MRQESNLQVLRFSRLLSILKHGWTWQVCWNLLKIVICLNLPPPSSTLSLPLHSILYPSKHNRRRHPLLLLFPSLLLHPPSHYSNLQTNRSNRNISYFCWIALDYHWDSFYHLPSKNAGIHPWRQQPHLFQFYPVLGSLFSRDDSRVSCIDATSICIDWEGGDSDMEVSGL